MIENSVNRALQIPLNKLKKPEEKRVEEIIQFPSTHNPNNPSEGKDLKPFINLKHSLTSLVVKN